MVQASTGHDETDVLCDKVIDALAGCTPQQCHVTLLRCLRLVQILIQEETGNESWTTSDILAREG